MKAGQLLPHVRLLSRSCLGPWHQPLPDWAVLGGKCSGRRWGQPPVRQAQASTVQPAQTRVSPCCGRGSLPLLWPSAQGLRPWGHCRGPEGARTLVLSPAPAPRVRCLPPTSSMSASLLWLRSRQALLWSPASCYGPALTCGPGFHCRFSDFMEMTDTSWAISCLPHPSTPQIQG